MIISQARQNGPDLICCCRRTEAIAKPVTSFDVEAAATDESGRRVKVTNTVPVLTAKEKLKPNMDGLRLFIRKKVLCNENGEPDPDGIKERIGGGILFTSMHQISYNEGDNTVKVGVTDFALSSRGEYPPKEEEMERFLTGGTFLHAALVPLSRTSKAKVRSEGGGIEDEPEHIEDGDGVEDMVDADEECYSYDKFLVRAVQNKNPIARFLYSLGSGNIFPRITSRDDGVSPPNADDITSGDLHPALAPQLAATAIAADLVVRTADVHEVGHAIKFVGFQLEHAKDTQLKEIFSKVRLTQSRYHAITKMAKEFIAKVLHGSPLGPRDLIFFSADNLQWRKGNKYDHWVTILMHVMTEEEMIKRGILNDDDPEARLSRERSSWRDYIDSCPVEGVLNEVFRPTETDYSRLGEALLSHLALTLQFLPSLPDVADCQARIRTKNFLFDRPLPMLHRLSSADDVDAYPTPEESSNDHEGAEIEEDCPTMWDKSNVHPSPAVRANMSSKLFLRTFLRMIHRTGGKQREDFNNSEDSAGKEPPVDKLFTLVDGAPFDVLSRILEADEASGNPLHDTITLVPGIFHLFMEIFKKVHFLAVDIASAIADSFMGKNGDDDISFFLNFNDPTKPEKQMSQVVLATMAYVYRCMEKDGYEEASPADAHGYMIEMAEECPTAKALLDLLLLYEIVILSRRAARLNDYDLVLCILRLSLPLFCVTHATGYVRIACDVLKFDKIMSPMERKIIKEYGLTMETVNGTRIARDQGHEKYNCLIDTKVGNYREGKKHVIESAAMTVIEREKKGGKRAMEKTRYGGYVKADRTQYWTHDAETYVKTTVFLDRSGIMERGVLMRPKRGRRCTNDKYCSASTGRPLPTDLMRWLSIGMPNIDQYIIDYYIEELNQKVRTEEHLRPILRTEEEALALKERLIKRATSTDKKELDDAATIPELVRELDKLCALMPALNRPGRTTESADKTSIINGLISVRRQAFRADGTLKASLEEEVNSSFSFVTTAEDRREEMLKMYYALPETVRTMPVFVLQRELAT